MKKVSKERSRTPKDGILGQASAGDSEFLSRSAVAFLDFPPEGDLFAKIADLLSDEFKNDAILAVSEYDEEADLFRPRTIRGLETMLDAAKRILGKDPMELAGDFGPAAKKILASGKFQKVEGGLRDFSNNLLPGPVAKALEQLLKLSGFYVVGFIKAGKIMGGISLVTRTEAALPEAALLEAFAVLAAVALERKRSQKSLRESEQRFRDLSSLTDEGIMIHEGGIIREANLEFAKLAGYANTENLIGKPGLEIIPFTSESRQRVLAHIRSGSTETYEIELVKSNGSIITAETHGKEIIYQGRPMRLISMRDVSERKRIEEKLAKSEQRFRLLSEMLPEIVFEADVRGNIKFANQSGIKSFGYTPEDLRSEINILSLIAPQDRETVQQRFQEIVRGTETTAREFQALRKDGSSFPIILHANVILEEGVPIGVRGIGVDITEQKRAEEKLHESEEYFRSLIEKGSDIISVMDKSTIIQYISPSVERILGYKPEELIGTSGFAIADPDDLKRLSAGEDFLAVLGTPGSVAPTVELRDRHKDGTWRFLEANARSIIDSNGELAIVTTAHDITERKQAEETIRASLREKEILLREIHHRVKNNMQVISSLFNLQMEHIADKDARRMLKEGQLRIRSMALIHEQLYKARDLSKIEFAFYIESLAVHLFGFFNVDPAQVLLETDLEDVRLDINTAVPCGLLVNELISNALKHAFPGNRKGTIRIKLRREKDGTMELCVMDDGVGFPDSLDFRGAGSFGLQIVNLLAEQLEASIKLDRKKGAAFTITFRELEYKLSI